MLKQHETTKTPIRCFYQLQVSSPVLWHRAGVLTTRFLQNGSRAGPLAEW